MSQLIDLGKLRFYFAGNWSPSTTYESNDIVKYGGNVYVYTYALKTAGVLPTASSHWALMIEGFNFQGVFSTSTNYKIGDGIAHGGVVYISVSDSINITPPNPVYWSKFLDGIQYEGTYTNVSSYQKNDVVKYGGSVYVAKQDTTNNLPTNTTFWDRFVEGVSPKSVYNDATAYVPNDLVAYGANIYRAKIETTGNNPSNTTYWELYVGGIKFTGTYSNVTEYFVNDIVVYGNNLYRSKLTQSNVLPTVSANWELLTSGNSYKGVYNNATPYFQGDIVNYGGNVYIALGVTTGDLPTDITKWQIYNSGFAYEGVWSSAIAYKINQIVNYGGSLYRAKSDNTNTNPTNTAIWDKVVPGISVRGDWTTATQYATDEVVSYGGNTYISILPHASTTFATDLAANKWQKFNSGIRWRGAWVSTTQYFKDDVVKAGSSSFIAAVDTIGGSNPAGGTNADWTNFATGAEGFLSKDGDTMLGMLTLFANPTDALHAATKQYVDEFLRRTTGGTITGPIVANGTTASYTAQNGAVINIIGGSLNLTNGSTITTDGSSTLGNTRVSGNLDVDGDLNVDGGDITVSGTTLNIANTSVTTVNAFGTATNITIGATTGTTRIRNNLDVDGILNVDGGDITVSGTTLNIANTIVTTVNAFGTATTITIGATTGTTIIRNNLDVDGNLNVDGGNITVSGTTLNIANQNLTTATAFSATNTLTLGKPGAFTAIKSNVTIDGVLDAVGGSTITNTTDDPTGFDNQHPNTRGVVEYSDNGTRIYSIDINGSVTVRENGLFASATAYSVTATSRTLAIFPAPGQTMFIYWISGIRYEKTTLQSVQTPSIAGYNYFYFNGGTLTSATTRPDDTLTMMANVAAVNGSSIDNRALSVEDQRHGISMDGATLVRLKRAEKAKIVSGYGITALTPTIGNYSNSKTGELRDADLTITAPVKTGNKFLTRRSAEWRLATADDNQFSYKLGVLSTVTVTTQGSGYDGQTTSLSVQGDGTGAVVTPIFAGAPLQSIVLVNGGYNYSSTSTITLVGDGSSATATLTVPAGNNIASATITNSGSRYTSISGAVVGGGGTSATVAITLNTGTSIAAALMTNLGSGYTTATVVFTGDGTGATATATIVAGAVTDINIVNSGTGYTFANAIIGGDGTGAAATVYTRKSIIESYQITNVGSGYTGIPEVVINGDGIGATATAQVTAGSVTDLFITNPGYGYTTATIVISGGSGSGATANAILSGYPIGSVTVTNFGRDYTGTPTVQLTANQYAINGAISLTRAAGNTISGVTLTNSGTNYTYATATVISSITGTGATFVVNATPSGILGVNVVNSGKHYSFANIIATGTSGAGFASTTTLTPVPQYNNYVSTATGYDLNNIPANKFTNVYFVATNNTDRVVKIPSSYIFDSIHESFQYATQEIKELRDYGLPYNSFEFVGFSVLNNNGEVVAVPSTNQGNNILYYDLLAGQVNAEPLNAGGTKVGRSPTISSAGTAALWLGATESAKVYYVAPHGVDTPINGSNLSTPFASVKYACQQAETGSTIFVKTGTYSEQLPITVPANVAIVGDNQRTTIIQPKSGNSDDGITPNNQATMFLMSNGSILNKMTFVGMTGWVPGSPPDNIEASTIRGVVTRLNPASPITTKSPYVLECSAIGSGLIGAIVDGSVHASGAKTMIFHGFTVISDNGIGYWMKDGGKAEIVSCFTYYCYFGYASTGGGNIRALNGNNSYGTWGALSQGFNTNEAAVTGALLGRQLNFLYQGGTINIGNTCTSSAGGTGIVTNVQYSANKVYLRNTSGTFTLGNTLTFTDGGTGTVSAGALEDQKGFVLILNNLTAAPKPGQSIQLAGDSISYVVQSISGTYLNTSSQIVVILAQEKPTGSASGTVITLRSDYSQIRLTGHDFLNIGTGGISTTNYPGAPIQPAAQGNETNEVYPGRVFYVSTDQDGNFRVGDYFRIDQATGRATLNANAFDLAGLTSLRLGSIGAQLGETINEFSSDGTLSGNSNVAVPTEAAVKTYVDTISVPQTLRRALLTPTYSNTTTTVNTSGYVTSYRDSSIELSNIAYNALFLPTSWTEKVAGDSTTFVYTVTYDINNKVTAITRV
jgi:hypothetical protein